MNSDNPEDVLSLFLGPKSNALGASLIALEAGQMFELDDPIRHSVLFKDQNKKTPRALFFDDSGSFELLEYLNPTNMDKKNSQISSLWNPKQLQVYNQKPEEPNEENSMKNIIFSKFSTNRNKLLPLPNFYTSKFLEFFQGNEALHNPEHVEDIRDILRRALEESDLMQGFQMVSDCDSGFGSYSHFVLEALKEESPKTPVFFIPVFESQQKKKELEKIQTLNQMFTLVYFKESANLILPLNFSHAVTELKKLFVLRKENEIFTDALHLAPILSNITLGYRLKEEGDSMMDYFNKLILFPTMSIFNVATTIPMIGTTGELIQNNILEFKKNKGDICLFNRLAHNYNLNKDYANYSEGYMLRGLFDEKLLSTPPNSHQYNIKGIEAVVSFEEPKMRLELSEHIAKNYENGGIEGWPLHTCLFTNDRVKDGLNEWLVEYKEIGVDLKNNYIEDEDFANDAFKEMVNGIMSICDNYDKKN